MAMTTATSTAAATTASTAIKGEPASPVDVASPSSNTSEAASPAAKTESSASNANGAQPPKRRAARRANTAERRATHNAVERMRRETLNGRFLTLASLLPPLAALRRPSKAAIVSSSIATVNAARRHRVLAAQTLRALTREAEQLRREVNEWRARARVPQLDIPIRSDAHQAVLRGELEDFDLTLEEGLELEEGEDGEFAGEDGAEPNDANVNEGDSPVSPEVPSPVAAPSPSHDQAQAQAFRTRARSASTLSTPGSAHGFYASTPAMLPQTPIHQHQRFAFDAPPASPSAASSASGSGGWDGPSTPPASAGMHVPVQGMMMPPQQPQMLEPVPVHPSAMKSFYDAQGQAQCASAGAAYDLGLGEESLLLNAQVGGGMGAGMMGSGMGLGWAGANPAHPAFHASQQLQQQQAQAQQAAIRLREVYEQQQQMLGMQMSAAGMVPMMGMQMGVGMVPMQMQMGSVPVGMQMNVGGMGMPMGVAQGQYLHQPTHFA